MTRAPRVFGFGLAMSGLALAAVIAAAHAYHQDDAWVDHTDEVRLGVSELFSSLRSAEMWHRGFLIDGVADPIDPYKQAVAAARSGIAHLRTLTRDNADEQRRLSAIEQVTEREVSRMDRAHEALSRGDWGVAKGTLDDGRRNVDSLRLLLGNMSLAEKLLLSERSERAEASAQRMMAAAAVMAILSLLTIGWAWQRLSGLAARLAQSEQKHRVSSLYDEMTGVYNRRGLFHAAGELTRKHETLTAVFADLDGLKSINDRLGHEMGDRAIREAAALLAGCLRPGDVVARLGGDELVCVLAGDCAPALISRIESALVAANTGSDRPFALRMSLGAAVSKPEESLDDLLARADAEMYDAKQARKLQLAA